MMSIVKDKFARVIEQWPMAILLAGVVLTLLWTGALVYVSLIILRLV